MCEQNFIKLSAADQQCSRFRTILDFDRKYLWNGSNNQ